MTRNQTTLAEQLQIKRRHMLQAENVARRIRATLERRGLDPAFSGFYLTRYAGVLLLIAELDTVNLERLERYTSPDLIHQISTNLAGMRVYISNSTGLRYVTALEKPNPLPKRIDLPPDLPRGQAALGVRYDGKRIVRPWQDLGHVMVAGATGSGKSMFLRLLVGQALRDGMKLLLADIDQATFPMLTGHPALLAPLGTTPQDAADLIHRALGECDHRARLYQRMPGYPESLDEYNRLAVKRGETPLPRILLILDEFSATLKALGGSKSAAADTLAALGFRGRKFGISVVFAAHEVSKQEVGLLRDQVRTVVMFRVQSADMARRMGCAGAHRISKNRPGLAITNRWGPMQTYFFDKARLIQARSAVDPLTPAERSVFTHAAANADGKVSIGNVQKFAGVTQWQARKWLQEWALRSWVQKDPKRGNAFVITEKMQVLLSNQQTPQTAANRLKPSQTGGLEPTNGSQTPRKPLSNQQTPLKPVLANQQTVLKPGEAA